MRRAGKGQRRATHAETPPGSRPPARKIEYPLDDEDIDSRTKLLLAERQKRRPFLIITPDEARRVLREFVEAVRQVDPGASPRTNALMRFAAAGFRLYLSRQAKTLDHAFRLIKARGNPGQDDGERWLIALAVREQIEQGTPFIASKNRENASVIVGKRFGKSETYARDAYVRFSPIIGIGRRARRQPRRR
ncbi:MAG TPA: hypothetical protein VFB99_22600 [Vicinamibacterales bacterium]|nr:hypothetical protein [Vicinamibacterales bacterium]HZM33875.1 hypothetical protein [Burkholderiales bacterium]